MIELLRQSALSRGDFVGPRRVLGAGGHEGIDNRRPAALFGDQPRGLRHQSERADWFAARRNLTSCGRGDSVPAAQCNGVKFAIASLALTFASWASSNSAASKLSLQQ